MSINNTEDYVESEPASDPEDEDQITLLASPPVEDTKDLIKSRHVLGLLGFFGFANVYAMRVNLSVAIVAMVNTTSIINNNTNMTKYEYCPLPNGTNNTLGPSNGPFNWDASQQSIVLGSFFYGYVLTQVPGGRLAELFGSKLIFGYGVLITAIFTLLSPIAAQINFPLFIIVRVLEGMGEGVTFPSMHSMLAKWIPPLERSKFAAYVYAGANFGTIVSLPVSGWLCALDTNGWAYCFYLFGALGIVWFVVWMVVIFDSPDKHPRITDEEKLYISTSIGILTRDDGTSGIPWMKMATCVPLWAILITQCGQSWAFYTQLTELPTYMSNILHFKIQQNALLSAIPYLTSWFSGILFSILADYLLRKQYLSLSMSYKIFNSIASIVPSLGLLGVAYVGCNRFMAQILLAVPGAFAGAVYAGNQMNHITLSPKYAGTMYGITNSAANMCGFLAPYVVGQIINGRNTIGQWRFVFYLAAGINIGTNLFYIAFASARQQDWGR